MAYKIEFITDTRFRGTKAQLISMDRRLKETGIEILQESEMREIDWDAEGYEGAKPSKQWRKEYIIEKGKFKTWRQAMGKINPIYAPKYRRV